MMRHAMTTKAPRRRYPLLPRPSASLIAIAGACLAWLGCAGGSGSSGFDISPSAERVLIDRALDEGKCVGTGVGAICPIDKEDLLVPLPNHIPGPAIEGVSLTTSTPVEDGFPCDLVDLVSCIIHIGLTATGLPEGSTLQVVWRQDDDGPWLIRTEGLPLEAEGRTEVVVELPVACTSIQVAALVFVDGQVLAHGTIDTLTESRAPIAFVMQTKPIRVETTGRGLRF